GTGAAAGCRSAMMRLAGDAEAAATCGSRSCFSELNNKNAAELATRMKTTGTIKKVTGNFLRGALRPGSPKPLGSVATGLLSTLSATAGIGRSRRSRGVVDFSVSLHSIPLSALKKRSEERRVGKECVSRCLTVG